MVVSEIIQNLFSFVLTKHKKEIQFVSIGAAVAFVLSYTFYDLYLLPPRNIRHVPHWRYADFIKKVLIKKDNFEQDIIPCEDGEKKKQEKEEKGSFDGLYLRPDRIGWCIHVSSPTGAKTILGNPDIFLKADTGIDYRETIYYKFVGGSNILMSNGDEYKKHQKTVKPAFHRSMPVQLFGRMTQKLLQEIDRLEGKNIDISDFSTRIALDIIGKSGFDFDFNATIQPDNEWVNSYHSIMEAMNDRLFYFLPFLDQNKWLLLFPERYQVHQSLDEFMGMLSDMIKKKRELIDNGNDNSNNINVAAEVDKSESDILSLMIESEIKGGEVGLTNEEISNNLCIFFFAGHETTANALAFAIYNLAIHQDKQEQARQEAVLHLGDASEDVLPTLEDTLKLKYINQIIKETTRMFGPIVDTAPRIATEDTYIDGVFVPKGTHVTVNIFNLHHNEKVWKTPNEFMPERFAPGGEADQLATGGINWVPFGNGRRQCIGMQFSLSEQKVILSMLLRKYTWALTDDSIHKYNVVTSGIISIRPINLRINFKNRY